MSRPAKKAIPSAKAAVTTDRCLPSGWRIVRFGDVVKDVNEAERNPLDAGLDRFVGLEHIEPENLHLKQWGNLADDEISFTKRFRKGQVLFGKRRAYQRKVAIADFDGICSSDILTLEPKGDDFLAELLPFIVQSEGFFEHALGTSSGSLSPRTRWNQLKDYALPLPPCKEQRRIADLLQASETVHQSYRLSLAGLLKARARILDDALGTAVGKCGTMPLAEGCIRVTDGTHLPPKFRKEGVPFFMVKTISSGRVDWSHIRFIDTDTYRELTRKVKPKRGDVLYTAVGFSYGVALHVDFDGDFAFQRHIAHIVPDPNILDPAFLTLFLNSQLGKRQADRVAIGTQQPTVTLRDLGRFRVPRMPTAEQNRIIGAICSCDVAIRNCESCIEKARQLTKDIFATSFIIG